MLPDYCNTEATYREHFARKAFYDPESEPVLDCYIMFNVLGYTMDGVRYRANGCTLREYIDAAQSIPLADFMACL